jgi:hypothetical protein
MSGKELFTEDEWHILQWAVTDTMALLSVADHGFWDTFKEASAAARFMAQAKAGTQSPLIHDLAGDVKMGRDKQVTHDLADMSGEVAGRVREAKALIERKAPEDVEAFRTFILGVAKATAEAAHGVDAHEQSALETLEGALA